MVNAEVIQDKDDLAPASFMRRRKKEMKRHAFGFGNAVNAKLLGAKKEEFPFQNKKAGAEYPVTWEDAQQYRKVVKDYFRDVLIASFSHPNFVAIVQWGFWENAHWKPQAALWRSDWTLKPAGEVFMDLVTQQWWTHEVLKTQEDGSAQVSGFLGEYQIRIEHEGKVTTAQTTLEKKGTQVRIELK